MIIIKDCIFRANFFIFASFFFSLDPFMPPQLNKPSLDPEFMPPQLNKTSLDPENSKMMHRIKQYVDQYRDMLCIELDSKFYYY